MPNSNWHTQKEPQGNPCGSRLLKLRLISFPERASPWPGPRREPLGGASLRERTSSCRNRRSSKSCHNMVPVCGNSWLACCRGSCDPNDARGIHRGRNCHGNRGWRSFRGTNCRSSRRPFRGKTNHGNRAIDFRGTRRGKNCRGNRCWQRRRGNRRPCVDRRKPRRLALGPSPSSEPCCTSWKLLRLRNRVVRILITTRGTSVGVRVGSPSPARSVRGNG